jgi:hypothetical protein
MPPPALQGLDGGEILFVSSSLNIKGIDNIEVTRVAKGAARWMTTRSNTARTTSPLQGAGP